MQPWVEVPEIVLFALGTVTLIAWVALLRRLSVGISARLPRDLLSKFSTTVAAVVPMRNEAENVEDCIHSLLAQGKVTRIVAVDDESTDGTGEILDRLALDESERLRVIRVAHVPPGWAGKAYACDLGSRHVGSGSEWLLFVDADTRLSPGAVDRALAYVESHDLDALSLFGSLRLRHAWDNLATPFYFALLNSFVPTENVNNPEKGQAYFVGSFILIRDERYRQIGGHSAIAKELVEDRALGRLAKDRGLKIALLSAPDDVSAEWAPGFTNTIDALMRVSVPPMRGRVRLGALFSLALTLLFLTPLVSIVLGGWTISFERASAFDILIVVLGLCSFLTELTFTSVSARRLRVPLIPYSFGFVPASLVYAVVLWKSVYRAWMLRPVRWRNRDYVPGLGSRE